jgi:medium-chain acyl-[acyl-carrier-protein] hydrolase
LVYRDWFKALPSNVRILSVEMPGRGSRLKEPPFTSWIALVDALAEAIEPLLKVPFALFAHSMGAVIAFELARRLRRDRGPQPLLLIVSGRRAPPIPDDTALKYDLPKDEFVEALRHLGGTPREVLEHAELMELMLPLIRADFQLIGTYEYHPGAPLECPIRAYAGSEDCEETLSWYCPGESKQVPTSLCI